MTDRTRRLSTANPRFIVTPQRKAGCRRGYDPGQIATVKLAIKQARYVPTLANGEARRIAEEHGVSHAMVNAIIAGKRGT